MRESFCDCVQDNVPIIIGRVSASIITCRLDERNSWRDIVGPWESGRGGIVHRKGIPVFNDLLLCPLFWKRHVPGSEFAEGDTNRTQAGVIAKAIKLDREG